MTAMQGHAQAVENAFDLGTLVLLGELQNRTLDDTQISVAVETGEDLERRGDQDIYDVVGRVPGVLPAGGEKGFLIRGVSQRASGGAGLAVTTVVDGVALPTNQATFFGPYGTWDVEQIEVFRGPQSTQQGRNALAGAVVLRTRDPVYADEASLRLEAGNRNFFRAAFMANKELLPGRLAFRIAGSSSDEDGYVFNLANGNDRYDRRSLSDLRGKLRWTPNDQFEAILAYSFSDNEGGEDFIASASFPAARLSLFPQDGTEGAIGRNASLRLKYTFTNGMVLENELNWFRNDYLRVEGVNIFQREANTKVLENDLRLRFDTERFTGVLGLFFTDINDDTFSLSDQGATTRLLDTFTDTTNYALYGEVEISAEELVPGLSFILGARYDVEEFTFANRLVNVAPPIPNPAPFPPSQGGGTTFEAFLPKVGVVYEFGALNSQSVGLTYQAGYRAGGAQINTFLARVNEFDPEFTDNIELSYRGRFFEDRLRVIANVFYTYWEDQQVTVFGNNAMPGDPLFFFDIDVVNAGKSELYGGELSIEGEPTARLHVYGSIAYAETKYIEFNNQIGATSLEIRFREMQKSRRRSEQPTR